MTDPDRLAVLEERIDLLHGMVNDLSDISATHQRSINLLVRTLKTQQKSLLILSQIPTP
jgi:hypothetical protein